MCGGGRPRSLLTLQACEASMGKFMTDLMPSTSASAGAVSLSFDKAHCRPLVMPPQPPPPPPTHPPPTCTYVAQSQFLPPESQSMRDTLHAAPPSQVCCMLFLHLTPIPTSLPAALPAPRVPCSVCGCHARVSRPSLHACTWGAKCCFGAWHARRASLCTRQHGCASVGTSNGVQFECSRSEEALTGRPPGTSPSSRPASPDDENGVTFGATEGGDWGKFDDFPTPSRVPPHIYPNNNILSCLCPARVMSPGGAFDSLAGCGTQMQLTLRWVETFAG